MGDNNTGFVDNAAKKAAEGVGNRVGNAAIDVVKKLYNDAQVWSGASFTHYLNSAIKRYNRIKTIATGAQYRSIIGENALYVNIEVYYQGKRFSTRSIEKLLDIDNNLLIEGTGGAGKSMLMRYLFLDTAFDFLNRGGCYVPVLLELRRLSAQMLKESSDEARVESLTKSVYSCMSEFDDLDISQFESSLRSGKLLLLFDGFDEVPEAQARDTAVAIQKFCTRYDKNPCIITTRPREDASPLETFSSLEVLPLSKRQAVELAKRIGGENEKAVEFYDQLDKSLYEQHRSFAENPLLLSMMYLTFMRNLSIPDHLCDFYQKAFDALYSEHDTMDKGAFHREFQCKTLDERTFQKLFSYFCFHSYFSDIYEFSEKMLLALLQSGIYKLKLYNVNANSYLSDLQRIVCMIVRDGDTYLFSHRSFQTYFAAIYTCALTDEEQKLCFDILFSDKHYHYQKDYFTLFHQLAPERFAANVLEDDLRRLYEEADNSPDPCLFFLKELYWGVSLRRDNKNRISLVSSSNRSWTVITLFISIIAKRVYYNISVEASNRILVYLSDNLNESHPVKFSEIDTIKSLTKNDRKELYQLLIQCAGIEDFRADVSRWLSEQDYKRKNLAKRSYYGSRALLEIL